LRPKRWGGRSQYGFFSPAVYDVLHIDAIPSCAVGDVLHIDAIPSCQDQRSSLRPPLFRHHVTDLWRRTLRRRSHEDRITWARMTQLADTWLPKPTILHPWPSARFAVTHPGWDRMRESRTYGSVRGGAMKSASLPQPLANDPYWHFSAVPTAPSNVGYRGQTGPAIRESCQHVQRATWG
jgi:hypothetical protein